LFPGDGELTISSGAITVTGVYHTIDTESDASSDDLVTINGGADGQILILRTENDARDVTLKTTGNIDLPADVTLATSNDVIYLIYDGAKSKWVQVGGTAAQGTLADTAVQPAAIANFLDFTQGTEQNPAAVTNIDFTSIPSGAKKIKVYLIGLSASGTDNLLFQIGDSGGVETTGYNSTGAMVAGSVSASDSTSGFIVRNLGEAISGVFEINLEDVSNFTWVGSGTFSSDSQTRTHITAGNKALSAELDRIRITTTGTDTLTGAINIATFS